MHRQVLINKNILIKNQISSTMKSTKKLLLVCLFALTAHISLSAPKAYPSKTIEMKFRKKIISQLKFPKEIVNADGAEAKVFFTIDETYHPQIITVESNHPEVEKYIRQDFERVQAPEEYCSPHETYFIRIKYRLEKSL